MPIRLLNQNPQYFKADGSAVLAGGTLTFSASGTANLKDTYTDPTLAAVNTNPVVLSASGQSSDIWLNGNYRVVLADSLGNVQWTRDNVQGPADLPTQAGKTGQVLSTDGTSLEWVPIIQVPDSTGAAGDILSTDGTTPFWQAPAASQIPALIAGAILSNDGTDLIWEPTSSSSGFLLGDIRIQFGSGQFPASGTNVTLMNVTFPTAFSSPPYYVGVTANGSGPTTIEGSLITSAIGLSAASFTANADTNFAAIPNSHGIVNITPFSWFAIGPK